MKRTIFFICIVFTVFFTAGAFSQDDVIIINNDAIGKHKRPLVKFDHNSHEELTECSRCHHDYDEFGGNTEEDGQQCGECHTKAAGKNPIPLMKAYHLQCKGCHKASSKKSGVGKPEMCGQCHIRHK